MTIPAMTTALNAVSNSSREPVAERDVIRMLQTGDGKGHLVRALFEDCSRETLEKIASSLGLTSRQLGAAYRAAKAKHHAANEEFDDGLE